MLPTRRFLAGQIGVGFFVNRFDTLNVAYDTIHVNTNNVETWKRTQYVLHNMLDEDKRKAPER